jgi:hypothetical protein
MLFFLVSTTLLQSKFTEHYVGEQINRKEKITALEGKESRGANGDFVRNPEEKKIPLED